MPSSSKAVLVPVAGANRANTPVSNATRPHASPRQTCLRGARQRARLPLSNPRTPGGRAGTAKTLKPLANSGRAQAKFPWAVVATVARHTWQAQRAPPDNAWPCYTKQYGRQIPILPGPRRYVLATSPKGWRPRQRAARALQNARTSTMPDCPVFLESTNK